ncbi:maleylacetoacetate isomerase isoform X2 [Folsomia candida]|uniref:maleylacetoacetate isomerase isoform X2 n=1 Tax=Folsomia candida TaxID=158441 RepID=UPI000B9058EC|nr:maleylacetoacetate isomerase isoform X2 [Folsomia candida]
MEKFADVKPQIEQDELLLYTYYRSSCSWRVRIALELKGLKYEIAPVHLLKSDQEFIKVSPLGQVPALVINKKIALVQSIAIMECLEERYPEPALLPKDLHKRATVSYFEHREICEIIASGIQPLQNLGTMDKISDDEDKKLVWAQYWIHRGLTALETILKSTSGSCCFGDDVTFADCCLVPQISNAQRFKVDVTPFPTLMRIDKYLSTIPAFQRAHASKQPDTPPEMVSVL